MKVITTPMCAQLLEESNIEEFDVVKPNDVKDADIAIIISETNPDIPHLVIRLNTYEQVLTNARLIESLFNTEYNQEYIEKIESLIEANNNKKENRSNIKVKVTGNFLKDTISAMGYTIVDDDTEEYDYIIMPDYKPRTNQDNEIIVSTHKSVPKGIIERLTQRYKYLESKLCMKQ
ncbi:MAG: hypothetical protein LUG89_00310 [Methanosphaera sp.]|nr:hypothetical protein [Methanosphaera sp.]